MRHHQHRPSPFSRLRVPALQRSPSSAMLKTHLYVGRVEWRSLCAAFSSNGSIWRRFSELKHAIKARATPHRERVHVGRGNVGEPHNGRHDGPLHTAHGYRRNQMEQMSIHVPACVPPAACADVVSGPFSPPCLQRVSRTHRCSFWISGNGAITWRWNAMFW